jgi:hypothetical protein
MKRVFLLLSTLLLLSSGMALAEPETGRVRGRIDCQSSSDCLGVAALWSANGKIVPAPDRHLLIPVVVSALDTDGSFELIAPVGDYYVGAQLRKTPGPLFGSPRLGDRIYLIREQDDTGYRVRVAKDKVTDIGLHSDAWTFAGLTKLPKMGISGQVVDADNRPVAGLLVFAFADPGAATSPLAASWRTGEDGRFVLPLVKPGLVYVRGRKNYRGGQPEADDYVGAAVDNAPQAVTVEPGRMTTGVKVLVRKLPSVLRGKNAPDTARPKFD